MFVGNIHRWGWIVFDRRPYVPDDADDAARNRGVAEYGDVPSERAFAGPVLVSEGLADDCRSFGMLVVAVGEVAAVEDRNLK